MSDLDNIPLHSMVGATTMNLFQSSSCVVEQAPGSFVSGSGDFKASWVVTGSNIQFTIEGLTAGWISFGIGNTPTMTNADYWTGWVAGGTPVIYDTWSFASLTSQVG